MSTKRKTKNKLSEDQVCQKFIQFLQSPVWQLPTISFIEQRSIIFDADATDEKAYKEVHAEFRTMIDFLIECFCEDLSITPAAVSTALQNAKLRQMKVSESLLEPILAVQDYPLFVHMMTRKNIELQIQALQMIGYMCGVVPEALQPMSTREKRVQREREKHPENEVTSEEEDRLLLAEIMRRSKEEYERELAISREKAEAFTAAAEASFAEQQRLEKLHSDTLDAEKRLLQLSISNVQSGAKEAIENGETSSSSPHQPTDSTVTNNKRPGSSTGKRAASKERPGSAQRKSSVGAFAQIPQNKSKERPSTSSSGESQKRSAEKKVLTPKPLPDMAVIQQRQEYMRAQRDKLLKMKAEERQKVLEKSQENDSKNSRPKTAGAARNVLRGRPASGSKQRGPPVVSEDVLKARLALAAKLKQELSI